MNIEVPKESLAEFCRKWKIVELCFFGSVLRDDFRPDSDVDVLVTFAPEGRYSLFDLVHIEEELEKMLGRRVDLVERSAIEQSENYIRRKHILNSAQTVYVA
jgi:predicted nucleotidyltransferase